MALFLAQTPAELAVIVSGPDSKDAVRPQRAACASQSGAPVEGLIGWRRELLQTIVDVEKDGVVTRLCASQHQVNVTLDQPNAPILEGSGRPQHHRPHTQRATT
jgi:hypothetical protein